VGTTDYNAPRYVVFSTPVALSLLGPDTFFSTLFSNTFNFQLNALLL